MRRLAISLIFLLNLGAVLLIWWSGSAASFSSGNRDLIFIALGRLTGLLGEFFILLQLILISRWPFVEQAYGFDRLNKLHRRIGLWLGLGLLAHPLLMTLGYAGLRHRPLGQQFLDFTHDGKTFLAISGLLIIVFTVILTRPFFRNRVKYEAWHALHLLIYLGIALILNHQFKSADLGSGLIFYYWLILNFGIFGLLLVYRFIRPFILFYKYRFSVEKIVTETHDVTSVYITGQDLSRFHFEAGQYIHVSFLAPGLWPPHPFSLSAPPDGQYLRLSIKAVGDYTSDLPKKLKPGTKVILEGPLGRFTATASRRDKYLLIAGGIGITPLRSLLETLDQRGQDAVLLYGNKTAADIVFETELENLGARVYHILGEHIDQEKISRLVPDFREREVYLCGPAPMMDSLIKILLTAGLPKKHLHYEQFAY